MDNAQVHRQVHIIGTFKRQLRGHRYGQGEEVKDGLKFSIRGKIAGFLIQDIDSMVTTAKAIEREIEDAQSIRDVGTGGKRKES